MVFCLVVCFGVNLFVTIFLCSVLFREVLLPHCRFKGYNAIKYLIPDTSPFQGEILMSCESKEEEEEKKNDRDSKYSFSFSMPHPKLSVMQKGREKMLPGRESNPGLPRDRRRY